MEIWYELQKAMKDLDKSLETLSVNVTKSAEAEREYRIAKAQKVLQLKQQGYPISIITDLAKGDKLVSRLCFERDVADGVLKANRDAVSVKMIEVSAYKTIFDKEYSNTK